MPDATGGSVGIWITAGVRHGQWIKVVMLKNWLQGMSCVMKKTFYDYFTTKFQPYIDSHQHGGIAYGGGFTQQPTSKSPKPDKDKSLTKNVKAG